MNNKLAIIILGSQNSGKTTTIKYFDKVYDENENLKRYCKVGWRHLRLFKGKLFSLITSIYFVPSSPTEAQKSLSERLGKMRPELILMAEQKNGKEYQNTIDFLTSNNYQIIEFSTNDNSKENWKRWTKSDMEEILEKRALEIGEQFKIFIKNIIK